MFKKWPTILIFLVIWAVYSLCVLHFPHVVVFTSAVVVAMIIMEYINAPSYDDDDDF